MKLGNLGRVAVAAAMLSAASAFADSTSSPPALAVGTRGMSLGEGQSWVNYGARSMWSNYCNDAGRAIQAQIVTGVTSRGGWIQVYVNGALVSNVSNGSSTDFAQTFGFVVPAGACVMVQGGGGRTGISQWAELR